MQPGDPGAAAAAMSMMMVGPPPPLGGPLNPLLGGYPGVLPPGVVVHSIPLSKGMGGGGPGLVGGGAGHPNMVLAPPAHKGGVNPVGTVTAAGSAKNGSTGVAIASPERQPVVSNKAGVPPLLDNLEAVGGSSASSAMLGGAGMGSAGGAGGPSWAVVPEGGAGASGIQEQGPPGSYGGPRTMGSSKGDFYYGNKGNVGAAVDNYGNKSALPDHGSYRGDSWGGGDGASWSEGAPDTPQKGWDRFEDDWKGGAGGSSGKGPDSSYESWKGKDWGGGGGPKGEWGASEGGKYGKDPTYKGGKDRDSWGGKDMMYDGGPPSWRKGGKKGGGKYNSSKNDFIFGNNKDPYGKDGPPPWGKDKGGKDSWEGGKTAFGKDGWKNGPGEYYVPPPKGAMYYGAGPPTGMSWGGGKAGPPTAPIPGKKGPSVTSGKKGPGGVPRKGGTTPTGSEADTFSSAKKLDNSSPPALMSALKAGAIDFDSAPGPDPSSPQEYDPHAMSPAPNSGYDHNIPEGGDNMVSPSGLSNYSGATPSLGPGSGPPGGSGGFHNTGPPRDPPPQGGGGPPAPPNRLASQSPEPRAHRRSPPREPMQHAPALNGIANMLEHADYYDKPSKPGIPAEEQSQQQRDVVGGGAPAGLSASGDGLEIIGDDGENEAGAMSRRAATAGKTREELLLEALEVDDTYLGVTLDNLPYSLSGPMKAENLDRYPRLENWLLNQKVGLSCTKFVAPKSPRGTSYQNCEDEDGGSFSWL